jgi:glucose-6-phosphate isomerase
MISQNISFKNFKLKNKNQKLKQKLTSILSEENEVINSLKKSYKNNYTKKLIKKFKNSKNFRLIGMGGSILGTNTIYEFLKYKIKKNFIFVDNLQAKENKSEKKKFTNLIVSKSGNTLETIVNTNLYLKKKDKNIFLTENKNNYLYLLAQKLKSEIVHHNNFIGGRYSVLSEVGMLPAELMGLDSKKFKQFDSLIKNKKFIKSLIDNVSSTLKLIKNKKNNSIIINYDEKSENLFKWYQQLVAESLGKDSIGILPIVSNMPKDNHSVMQLYLDGYKNNFFTFFYVNENKTPKINNIIFNKDNNYLKNKNLSDIIYAQFKATQNVFAKKNIPFRSFEIKKRNEKTLGELFSFFILETILLGRALNINPYNQPAVELIKKETNKILL